MYSNCFVVSKYTVYYYEAFHWWVSRFLLKLGINNDEKEPETVLCINIP